MKRAPIKKAKVRSIGEQIHELAVIIFIGAIILFLMVKIVFD